MLYSTNSLNCEMALLIELLPLGVAGGEFGGQPQDRGVGEAELALVLIGHGLLLDQLHVLVGQIEVAIAGEIHREIEIHLDLGDLFHFILGKRCGQRGSQNHHE